MLAKVKTSNNEDFKPGQEFKIRKVIARGGPIGRVFSIDAPTTIRVCLENECAQLNGGSWEIIEEDKD